MFKATAAYIVHGQEEPVESNIHRGSTRTRALAKLTQQGWKLHTVNPVSPPNPTTDVQEVVYVFRKAKSFLSITFSAKTHPRRSTILHRRMTKL